MRARHSASGSTFLMAFPDSFPMELYKPPRFLHCSPDFSTLTLRVDRYQDYQDLHDFYENLKSGTFHQAETPAQHQHGGDVRSFLSVMAGSDGGD